MKRIARHNLSGGRLGKPLWTRSDLEAYHKGNHVQTNFLSTPYGGLTRRPPATLLGSLPFKEIGGVWYRPSTVRGFSFIYDITTKYSVLLVGYTADGEDDVPIFEILSDAGDLKASVTAPYAIADFVSIDYKQVNDVIMFAHNQYPTAQLVRYGDTDWRYEIRELNGGPFLANNLDSDKKLNIGLSTWRDDFNYAAGDIVLPQSATSGTASWIGTAFSMVKDSAIVADNPVSGSYGAIGTWETQVGDDYLVSSPDFCSRTSTDESWYEKFWYPYTYIRIDKAFSAGISVSDNISWVMDYVESGGDDSFSASGTVLEILVGTAYEYIKLDLEYPQTIRPYILDIGHQKTGGITTRKFITGAHTLLSERTQTAVQK
jgi:hypothetical protein